MDDLIFESAEKSDFMDQIKKLHQNGELVMKEEAPELINGFDKKLFEDETLYDDKLFQYLKAGVFSGLGIFLVGWLALGYLWTSLAAGVVVALFIVFKDAFALDSAKEE